MTTSLSAHDILDLLDDPAQIAAATADGHAWITTDRHLRAQATLFARASAQYEQQITDLLDALRLPRRALVYRGTRLVGVTAPAAVTTVGAPPGWKVVRGSLVPASDNTAASIDARRVFGAAEFRPTPAQFIDGFGGGADSELLAGGGALVFIAADEASIPDGAWQQIPAQLWAQVQQYANEDLSELGMPRPPHRL